MLELGVITTELRDSALGYAGLVLVLLNVECAVFHLIKDITGF